jgi:serine phosphatase RsbU (regulator of sigma subunit)
MLLPPLSFCAPAVAVAGLLEPAYEVGGDAFDYSLNGELLGFAVFDSMGHGLQSALASTLALAAFRYGRRRGLELTEIAKAIDEALISEFHGEVFVTGHLLRLDTETGEVSWINAGHPDPLLIRDGIVIAEPHADPCLPLGLGVKITEVGALQLVAGDRLLFYSDGVIEARTVAGEHFELERLRATVERYLAQDVVPAEVLRRTVADVRSHSGQELQDDATLVMIEWQPDLLLPGPVRAGRRT